MSGPLMNAPTPPARLSILAPYRTAALQRQSAAA